MVIWGDYHTHTIYSSGPHNAKHATGTILENAMVAKEKVLSKLPSLSMDLTINFME